MSSIYIFSIFISYISFSKAFLANAINSFLPAGLALVVVIATFLLLHTGTLISLSLSIYLLPLCFVHSVKLLVNTINSSLTTGYVSAIIVAIFLPLTLSTLISLLLLSCPLPFCSMYFVRYCGNLS